jgi:hypothetical protein
MAKRFGRNQRRRMRLEIVATQQALYVARANTRATMQALNNLDHKIAEWAKCLRGALDSPALNGAIRMMATGQPAHPHTTPPLFGTNAAVLDAVVYMAATSHEAREKLTHGGSAMTKLRCQIQLSPECTSPEVYLDCPPYFRKALACIPCGKAFQTKFPHAVAGISLRPIPEETEAQP